MLLDKSFDLKLNVLSQQFLVLNIQSELIVVASVE